MEKFILAIDQGTTSTRAIIFNNNKDIVGIAQKEIKISYPHEGWVLQDAQDIWLSVLAVVNEVLIKNNIHPEQIAAIGITNQRETTVIWDKNTGLPIYSAIVWQSRQSSSIVSELKRKGYGELFKNKTGLPIDAYFSSTKVKWILDNVEGAREKANNNELLFGTIDTWIIYNLSKNRSHITDYSNASRTQLFNIYDLCWDQEILDILDIPANILPEVRKSSEIYTVTSKHNFFGLEVPICGIGGDQQAALFGQGCINKGNSKATFGTGCFILMNTGSEPVVSNNGLITTLTCVTKEINYALEGSIFVSGSAIQWLRDGLKIINSASETNQLATMSSPESEVCVVPSFVGLGSPYWEQDVRGAMFGLTRGTTSEDIVRATLEGITYPVKDIIDIMEVESDVIIEEVKVDGGASNNDYLMQFNANMLNKDVVRPKITETTALGAALLAGLAIGYWNDLDLDMQIDQTYSSKMVSERREYLYERWKKAVEATILFK